MMKGRWPNCEKCSVSWRSTGGFWYRRPRVQLAPKSDLVKFEGFRYGIMHLFPITFLTSAYVLSFASSYHDRVGYFGSLFSFSLVIESDSKGPVDVVKG